MARIKPQALLVQSKKKKGPTRINITSLIFCNVIIVLIVFSLVATYRHFHQRPGSQDGATSLKFKNNDDFGERKMYDLPNYAIISTSKGSITVKFNKDVSPEVVDKFLDFCQKEYFKGMPFNRVIKHYLIQGGGDLKGLGTAGDWILKGKPRDQAAISPKHGAFMLGTSKDKRDVKGFNIFIMTAPIPDLSDKIIVFGQIIKGDDVVQEIEEVDTDEHYRPKSPIEIINITLKHEP